MADRSVFPIMHGKYLKGIPWELIAPHERQAQDNHDQSLKRLAERGGLSPCEALVILENRSYDFGASQAARAVDEITLIRMLVPTNPDPEDG